jgi:hypothetical protein
MKCEFGIAYKPHHSGASANDLTERRFPTFRQANKAAHSYDDCFPSIYLIIDDKYVFHFRPYNSEVWENIPEDGNYISYILHIESKPWGQIRTLVWWEEFVKNPEQFFHLAERILD